MASNDRVLLDTILEQSRAVQAAEMSEDKFFEFFATDQVLKEYGLSADELKAGIVDGGGDGGFDSVYIFVNGQLLADDYDFSDVRRGAQLELVCMQTKNESGFGEDALNRIRSGTENLLDLSKQLDSFKGTYNDAVRGTFQRFREAYNALALKFPEIAILIITHARATSPTRMLKPKWFHSS